MLVSGVTVLTTYEDNQKKNLAWKNISTKLQMTGKLSMYKSLVV